MTRVAAVLVTSNSQSWIGETLDSVLRQTREPDGIVIIDDRSVDGTRDVIYRVLGTQARIVDSTAVTEDRTTRIAHNFRQGLDEVRSYDVAVLGDHDDIWHPNRVGHQVGLLENWRDEAMVASNGRLVNEDGEPTGGTLRDAFPMPIDWATATPAERMRTVLRHSVATGGASAVRPVAYADVTIPSGWLHDRWWSLVAASREELRLDEECVIDYRISHTQEVGLDRGQQGKSLIGRARAGVASLPRSTARLRDLRRLASMATPSTAAELRAPRLLRNLA
jgi:glycosyltransferase involved in cell wall biosynthesis